VIKAGVHGLNLLACTMLGGISSCQCVGPPRWLSTRGCSAAPTTPVQLRQIFDREH